MEVGVWYFGTISLDVPYRPSQRMLKHLKRAYTRIYAVIETGNSGKEHFHFLGLSERRQDNLRSAVKRVLVADEYELSDHSLVLTPAPNVLWRLGYMTKEPEYEEIMSLGIFPEQLEQAKTIYAAKPKKVENTSAVKPFSLNQLIKYLRENNCTDRDTVSHAMAILEDDGRFPFDRFHKLNMKKLLLALQRRYCDDF